MILTDPNNQLGMNPLFMDDSDNFVDDYGNEYEYDEFIGKWLKKRKERRANDPRIIAKRRESDKKRMAQGKPPRYPELHKTKTVSKSPIKTASQVKVAKDPTAPKGSLENPINNKDLKSHKVMNNAVQNELKTMQEELKTEGLQKRVEQEDLKKENLKQQAGLMGAGKGLIVVVGVLGTIALLAYLGKSKAAAPAPAAA